MCALMHHCLFRLEEGWNPREYETGFLDEHFVAAPPALPVALTPRW